MKLVDRLLQAFLLLLIISGFLVPLVPPLLDAAGQYYYRERLDTDVDTFYTAVRAAHDTALRERQRIGVEVSSRDWITYQDGGLPWQRDERDNIMARGTWNDDLKFGSTIPGNTFFFDAQGRCYINEATGCIDYADAGEPEQPSTLAFTAKARRIYTLFFAEQGAPILEYDDF